MKLFYSVNRLLVLLLTVSFLIFTSTSFSQTTLSFTSIPVSDPDLVAPGRGAEQWHDRTDVNVPIQGTNTRPLDVYYRFVATRISTPTKGVYNFSYLDNLFNAAINNKQKISFGIMTVYPDGGTDVGLVAFDGGTACYPQWLHQEMQAESVKDWRTGSTWTPNYNSPRYLSWLVDLNKAVNAHIESTSYNGVKYSDIVNCVDIRGYGAWGEWHSGYTPNNQISDYPSGTFPTVSTLKQIVDSHVQGFPNFQLVNMIAAFDANYLGNTMNPPEIAHYILTHRGNNAGPIGWRRDQWGALDSYLKAYLENNTRSFNGVVFNTLIMERWKTAPITGEPPAWIPDDYSDLERQIRLYHATSFGNGNYGTNSPNTTIQGRVRAASKASGYRLVLEGGSMATSITTGTSFPITLNWKNIGLSPTYENWDVVYELKNSGGTTVWSGTSGMKLRLFLPQANATAQTDNLTVPTSVAAGTYSLILYVKDPSGYRQPLPLAITGRRSDGGYVLRTSVNVTTGTGQSNTPPVANAGPDRAITLPTSSASLTGSGTDADGTIASYLWTQVSGPSTSTFSATNTGNITVSDLEAGNYTYRLTVTDDDGSTDTDDVTVTVTAAPVNQTPIADAGANKTITLPTSSTTLNGSASTDPDGTIAGYQWQQVSGPSTSTLSSTTTANITVSNLQAGTYTYRLTVTDDGNATDNVTVTVTVNNALVNQAPVANAGSNRTITLPTSSASLTGSGTDADGTIAGYGWQQVSGPSVSTLSSTTTANITVSNLQAGTYTYRLTVTDNGSATGTDEVTVTVNTAANQAPVANAGANRTITLPTSSTGLTGSGTDVDGTIEAYLWQQTSGPSASTLSATNTASISVSDLVAGIYTYRLTVTDDDGSTDTDLVTVTVNAAASNQAPTANAGANRTITLPTNSASLSGSASTDADGTITSYSWQQVSGPSASTLSATNTAAITVSNLQAGVYIYRLTVRDNDNSTDTDDVTVTVNNAPANQAPNADAGTNRRITLPTNSTSLSGTGSADADGTIAGYQWRQVSGPSASALSSTTAASITVSNLQAGTYTYRLTVTDNDGATDTDDVTVTVNTRTNQAPSAKAGSNRAITLPTNTTSLSGAASADADGTITSYQWQQVSGPSTSDLSSTTNETINVNNLQAGVYTYRLTVTDDDNATATDEVTVTVYALPNEAPIANAGTNLVITLPTSSANLVGSGIDTDGTIAAYQWQQISGPTTSTLSATTTANITVSNLQAGVYIYRLTVRDNDNATGTDNITVTVNIAPPNQAPVANAGTNRSITLPTNSTSLSGSASTDADGTIASYQWQQISGPSVSTLSSTNRVSINVSNLQTGVYTYRLTVRDNDNATSVATVTVTVSPVVNRPPVADAGIDQTIVITANSTTLNAEQSTDPDGNIISYTWRQVSGPGTSAFSATSGITVDVSNLLVGEYIYRLTVRDNDNATATATVKVIVIDNFRNFTDPVAVYPNPATEVVNVRLLNPRPGTVTINIYDMNGKVVLPKMEVSKPAGAYSVPVTVSSLRPGSYVIQVSTFGFKKMATTFIKL